MPNLLGDEDTIDPNFVPPTRPPSALSANSDTSYFALYEDSDADADFKNPPVEYLPRRIVVETMRRHGRQCLLCSSHDDLVVVRVVLQHSNFPSALDMTPWLKSLALLPSTYDRDDWTNLMTLCRAHAQAYDDNAWRWVPGTKSREQMAGAIATVTLADRKLAIGDVDSADMDVTMTDLTVAETPDEPTTQPSGYAGDSEEGVLAETLVDDGISGNTKNPEIHFRPMDLPPFDVLVFRPDSMPLSSGAPSPSSLRVWRDWRKLTLNPYIAYASTLSLIEAKHWQEPDAALRQVGEECLAIRARWNLDI